MKIGALIRAGLVLALISTLPSALMAAPRVAVFAPPGLEEPAILLTAALSSQGELEVMEREQLDTIMREKNLRGLMSEPDGAAQVGRILGVDTLIILANSLTSFSARAVAVGPGLVLGEFGGPWPLEEPDTWAKLAARRMADGLRRAPIAPGEGILLSIAPIRSSLAGTQDQAREVFFALNRSLAGVPNLFLLDRSLLREADWEKQLSGAASQFWASSWVFDATVTQKDRLLVLDGRLRQNPGGAEQTMRLEADTATSLGEATAAEIARLLQKPAPPAAGPGEAAQFQEEAQWALRWNLFDQAERSADAAWFLGGKNEVTGMLRAMAAARNAHAKVEYSLAEGLLSNPPPPRALYEMTRAFSHLHATVRQAETTPSLQLVKDAIEMVAMASTLLKAYYYLPRERTPEEDESLRWLRGQLRAYQPVLLEASAAAFAALKPHEQKNLIGSPTKFPVRLFVEAGWNAPLWNETPETSAQAFEQALAALDKLPPELRDYLISQIIQEPRNHKPLVVAWEKSDRPLVSGERQKLLQRIAAKNPQSRLDALSLQINLLHHFGMPAMQKKVPHEKALQAVTDFYEALFELRAGILNGSLSIDHLGRAMDMAANFVREETFAPLKPEADAARRKLLLALLAEQWPGRPEIYNRLVSEQTFPTTERDTIFRALDELQKRQPSSFLNALRRSVESQTSSQTSAPAPKKPTPKGLAATTTFPLFAGDEKFVVDAFGKDGVCIVKTSRRSPEDGQDRLEILEFEPATGRHATVKFSDSGQAGAISLIRARDLSDSRIYFADSSQLYYMDRKTGQVGLRAMPALAEHPELLRAVKGKLYVALAGGAIVRIDPADFSAELIASAQRRPAQTPLDDRPPFTVSAIFPWEQGVAFLVGREAWLWNETTRTFQKMPQNPVVGPGQSFDRNFFRKWIEVSQTPNEAHWMLLLDQGNGQVPAQTGAWPPFVRLQGQEKFPPHIFDTSAHGSDFVILFSGGADRGSYLRVDRAGRVSVVPLAVQNSDQFSDVIALPNGVAIWGRSARELRLYSYEDIEKFQPTP